MSENSWNNKKTLNVNDNSFTNQNQMEITKNSNLRIIFWDRNSVMKKITSSRVNERRLKLEFEAQLSNGKFTFYATVSYNYDTKH